MGFTHNKDFLGRPPAGGRVEAAAGTSPSTVGQQAEGTVFGALLGDSMTPLEFIQQAKWFAKQRCYKASWVYVVFRERYGIWPEKLLKESEPQEASSDFIAWVFEYWRIKSEDKRASVHAMAAQGMTQKEIALEAGMKVRTVRFWLKA